MILHMVIRYGSYNEKKIFGLGNALHNFLMTNNVLGKDFDRIHIVEEESICLLQDDKNLIEHNLPDNGVCIIELAKSHDVPTKYATLSKTAEFLRNINTLFSEGELTSITVKKVKNAEIL